MNRTSNDMSVSTDSKESSMLSTFKKAIIALVAMAAVVLGIGTSASASTSTSQVPGTVTVTQPVFHKASASATVTGVVQSKVSTTTQGSFVASNGYTPSNYKKLSCPKVTNSHKIPRGVKCIWLKKGQHFVNSYIGRDGKLHWFADVVGSKHSPGSWNKFYYDTKRKTWRRQLCGNYVKFGGTAPKPPANLVIYRSFGNISWTDTVRLTESGSVSATATCVTPGSSASATASASASVSVYVKVSVSAKYSTTAKLAGTSKVSVSTKTALQSSVIAKATASLKASAQAKCSYTPPTPVYQAPSVSASANACVKPGETSGVITGTVANNNDSSEYAVVTIGSKSTTIKVPANGTQSFTLPGFAAGSYTGTATFTTLKLTATFSVSVEQCEVPKPTPPSIVDYTKLQNVQAGQSSPNTCVTFTIPVTSKGATVYFIADFGSFSPSSVQVTESGKVCSTYTASADVNPTDTVKFKVVDNTTGLSATSDSQEFPITPAPVHP